MTEVREMTRSEAILAISPISSSVIPSEKYSCSGFPDRFSSGSTAMESIRGEGAFARKYPIITRSTTARPPAIQGKRRQGGAEGKLAGLDRVSVTGDEAGPTCDRNR